VTPDPKWLEILKVSGWQTAALAFAFGVFLLLPHFGLLQQPEPWITTFATLAFLVCMSLALASFGHAVTEIFPPNAWVVHWINKKRQRRMVGEYIPHMTETERSIIAYLLAKNQKMITGDRDGGYASTLISKGILIVALRAGQVVDTIDVPFIIPDPIWCELTKQKVHFPYDRPKRRDGDEPHPWRRPW
jgi:Super-infection exclusion protein B